MSLTVPNLLSLLRMGLIPLFVLAALQGSGAWALAIFGVAAVTDILDGFVARYWRQQSALGAYLDPAADKLLVTTAYVVLAMPDLLAGVTLPVWVAVLVIARDVVIVVVALLLHLALGIKRFQPTALSKLNTVVQMAAVGLVLLTSVRPGMEALALGAIYSVVVLTVATALDYFYRFLSPRHLPAAIERQREGAQNGPPR